MRKKTDRYELFLSLECIYGRMCLLPLYGVKSCLNEETIEELQKLVKLLDEVTTYENIEDGDDIFELADSIENCIMDAEESLGKVSEFVSKVVECWPDPDEEFEDER